MLYLLFSSFDSHSDWMVGITNVPATQTGRESRAQKDPITCLRSHSEEAQVGFELRLQRLCCFLIHGCLLSCAKIILALIPPFPSLSASAPFLLQLLNYAELWKKTKCNNNKKNPLTPSCGCIEG